jgi:hypothetical protein
MVTTFNGQADRIAPWFTPRPGQQPPGRSKGVLAWLKEKMGGWITPRLSKGTVADVDLRSESVRSGPPSVILPLFLPYFDSHQTMGETAEMRVAYRRMLDSPHVKAAFLGKVLAVCALDLEVIPADRKNPRDQRIAEFVRYNLEDCLQGGIDGALWNILSGALIDGYSVNEKVWALEERGDFAGKYALRALKPKDTGNDIVLQLDEFRNIVGLMGLRYNPGTIFPPSEFVIYQHLPLWGFPGGMSDFRGVYSSWWMLDTVRKLRAKFLESRTYPVAVGTFKDASDRPSLERALAQLRSSMWLAIPDRVQVQALEIAGGGDEVFASACKDFQHEIFLGLQGAILQQLEGETTDGRGNSQVHRSTSDQLKWHLARNMQSLLNDRETGLIKDIVDINYVVDRYPRAKLSAVDINEQARELEIDNRMWSMGVELSKQDIYERYNRKPPEDDDDRLFNEGGQKPPPGEPGANGSELPFADDATVFDGDDFEAPPSDQVSLFTRKAKMYDDRPWDESKVERNKGRFAKKGQGGGKAPDRESQHHSSWLALAAHLPKHIASKAKHYAIGKYHALEAKYGRKWAIAIMGAGIAGLPLPVPGSSVITAAPVIAAAWLHKKLSSVQTHDEGFDPSKHPHAPAGSSKGGQFVKKGSDETDGEATTSKREVDKPMEGVAHKGRVAKQEHVHAAKIENEIASHVGGETKSLEDGKYAPRDVEAPKKGKAGGSHQIEVKSILKGKKNGVTMHDDALLRKVDFMASRGGDTYHTIAIDERDVFSNGDFADRYSGHRIYYKRGAGKYTFANMHKVESPEELKRLLEMPDHKLPERARGALPSDPEEIAALRNRAAKEHEARLRKDRALKAKKRAAKIAAKLEAAK